MKKGFTLIELLVVVGIIVILAVVSLVNLVGRRNTSQLVSTASEMTALLREAQSRSVSQASSTTWGVHFDNGVGGAPPFFALFAGTYSTSSALGYYALPPYVSYVTGTVPAGAYIEISFKELSGQVSGSSSLAIRLNSSPNTSSTITVASSGAVSY